MRNKIIIIVSVLLSFLIIGLLAISIYNSSKTSDYTSQNAKVDNSKSDSVLRVSNANLEEDGNREKQELKVYVININPTLYSITDQNLYPNNDGYHPKVTDWFGQSETALVDELVEDLEYSSHGYLDVNIVKTERLNEFPKYTKEFYLNDTTTAKSFDENTYIERSRSKDNSNKGDWYNFAMNKEYSGKYSPTGFTYDYEYLLEKYDLVNKRNAGEFDQVWLCSLDPSDAYEDMMVGRTPYFVNGGVLEKDCPNFIIFSPTFSRRDSSLHALGHAFENVVRRAFNINTGEQKDYTKDGYDVTTDEQYEKLNLWEKFSLSKFNCTGDYAGVGNVHLPPNAEDSYDYENSKSVYSTWVDWKNYPNLTGKKELTNYTAWMNQTELDKLQGKNEEKSSDRMFVRWWLSLFPHVTGYYEDGHFNNWWKYICSLDFVESISRSDDQNKNITVGTELKVNYQLVYQSKKVENVQSIIDDKNVSISDKNVIRFVNGKLIAKSPGTSTITIKHDGHSITYDIKVPGVFVTGINLDKTNLEIKEGKTQTLTATILPENATNKNVKWSSSNEKVATVNNGVVTAISEGTATITVTTDDGAKKATCNVKVLEKDVKKIEVKKAPTKTTYIKGEKIDVSGGIITVIYEDDTTKDAEITEDMVTGYDKNMLGEQTLTVTLKGNTTTFKITVKNDITGIKIKSLPTKTTYIKGEDLDLTGGEITVTYEDGSTNDVNITENMVTGYNKDTLGEQLITITYAEQKLTFNIVVKNEVVGIKLKSEPTKTTYIKGEDLDLTGGEITVTYEDKTTKDISITEDMITGYNKDTLGEQTITVTYSKNTETFKITVKNDVDEIELENIPSKTIYIKGEKLSLEGGKLKVIYEDKTSKEIDITEDMVTGYDKDTLGEQTITITYGKKTVTYKVKVKNDVEEIIISKVPEKLIYEIDDDLDVTGGKIKVVYENGESEEIDMDEDDVSIQGYNSEETGEQTITVIYKEKKATFNITVRPEESDDDDDEYDDDSVIIKNNDTSSTNKEQLSANNDNSKSNNKILPKTGFSKKVFILITIVIILVGTVMYIKFRKLKDVNL